jgi:hypothetical protein
VTTLSWIQDWYSRHCNGVWEHSWGIKIDNIDNPGWMVTIDLRETELFEKTFAELKLERSETDWMHCFIREAQFRANCGPANLEEALQVFRSFADTPQ